MWPFRKRKNAELIQLATIHRDAFLKQVWLCFVNGEICDKSFKTFKHSTIAIKWNDHGGELRARWRTRWNSHNGDEIEITIDGTNILGYLGIDELDILQLFDGGVRFRLKRERDNFFDEIERKKKSGKSDS